MIDAVTTVVLTAVTSVTAVVAALVGARVGARLTHRHAIALAESNARRFAGVKLREAFAPEIAKFSQPLNMILSADILETAFEKHHIAVNEFRFYLSGEERDAFDKVWQDYYCSPDGQVDFSSYFGGEEEKKDALARMEAIVAFTKR